jgi:hypothetical protein
LGWEDDHRLDRSPAFEKFTMKNVVYGEKLRQTEALLVQAQQATRLLEEILGPSAGQVTAEWDRSDDPKGRALMMLRISDWTGAKSTAFDPWELEQPTQLRVRLYRLWGDLLQARNEKQLQELMGTAGEGE